MRSAVIVFSSCQSFSSKINFQISSANMNFTCCAYDVSVLCVLQAVQSLEINIQTLLYTDAFTQTLLHTGTFAHRRFYTSTLLHTDAITQRHFYTETLLHHRRFYTQMLLHTEALTHAHRSFVHTEKKPQFYRSFW